MKTGSHTLRNPFSDLLLYSLCGPDGLSSTYESLIHLLRVPSLIPHACELLTTLTEKHHVTKWRTETLRKIVLDKRMSAMSKRGPAQLLRKYKDLRPDLIPQNLSALARPLAPSSTVSVARRKHLYFYSIT